MLDENKIKQIGQTIVDKIDIRKVILFGSYAYGKPTENSDLDICIVKKNIKNKIKEKREIRDLLKDIKVSKDILLVDEKYYKTHSDENWINTALYDAKKYGRVLYEQK